MNIKQEKIIIFSDIDGTILDKHHNSQKIRPLIEKITSLDATLILCSSKTKPEIEFYMRELGINNPFIVENGGAIYVQKGYFSFSSPFSKEINGYDVVELGLPYSVVRERLNNTLSMTNCKIASFGDMTREELAAELDLPLDLAELAKMREYDEPFLFISGDKKEFEKTAKAEGLTLTFGNKYSHVLGNSNKGKAVTVLKTLLVHKFTNIITFGIGDSENDLSMLSAVDKPMLIRKELGGKDANLVVWNNVLRIIEEQKQ